MDFSSTQQQNREYASQSYDPTQFQSYDQSYYSYYQQQIEHQQPYAYYPQSDYSIAYQGVPQLQYPETGTFNPPGVSVSANEVAQISDSGVAQQMQQRQSSYYPGLNPAAAAAAAVTALSQLAQFSGTMQAAERAMAGYHPMVEPRPMHMSGSGSFQGGGHENFGHRHPSSTTSGQSFQGRGLGRRRGGRKSCLACGALSTSSHPESSAAEGEELAGERADLSTVAPEKAAQLLPESSPSATEPGKDEPSQRPPKSAWCELCRVDCTSLQILEQHQNGKRHRKNLLRIEELRKAVKPVAETQNEQKPISESKIKVSQQPEFAHEQEAIKAVVNVPTENVTVGKEMQAEHQNKADKQPEVSVNESSNPQTGKPRMDRFDNWRYGMKRKMRGGRGGKCMKISEGPRQPLEPPKPRVVIPLICNLCNVKCDTQEVFDRHLSGKKHIAQLKRFEDHQAMYGPEGVQALYPPNPIAQILYHPQNHHQQAFYGSQGSYPPPGAYMPSKTYQAAGTELQFQQ